VTIEELLKDVDDDLEINSINVQKKLFEIPKLYSKYINIYHLYYKQLLQKRKELDKLYKLKYEEYRDGEQLLDKKEIFFYILGDDKYSKLKHQVDGLDHLVDILDRTVKRVNSLSFDMRNAIDYLKFIEGG
jgi:hypothetical protein